MVNLMYMGGKQVHDRARGTSEKVQFVFRCEQVGLFKIELANSSRCIDLTM